jgi:DNA-binding NtrC family response regulator
MSNLLIVDDEQSYRQLLTLVFEGNGHQIRTAMNGREAIEMLQTEPAEVIITDVRMPDMDGIELLRAAREFLPDVGVVLMTAFATVDTAREAFKLGADDFIQKPFDVEELKVIVKKAFERQALLYENRAFKRAQRERGSVRNIIGRSDKMQAVYQMIETVAEVQSTVLVTGESGTGKELVARAIHDLSPRAEKPFISINCGAFTETLLESELFGYVKGSFTGANANRKGLFEAAHKGTIFLDEIGEMSPAMQVKLLRVLQERKVRPVGAHDEMPIDARVIAATNRDLKQMSADGSFREDLFYRISVIPISLPPLRERSETFPNSWRISSKNSATRRVEKLLYRSAPCSFWRLRLARERPRTRTHHRARRRARTHQRNPARTPARPHHELQPDAHSSRIRFARIGHQSRIAP